MNRRTKPEPWAILCLLVLLTGLGGLTAQGKPAAGNAASRKASAVETAQAQLARGDLQGAENETWKILAASPENADALTLLGIIRGQQRRYAEAESLFTKVVKLDPKSVPARLNLAKALLAQDKVDDAIQEFKNAQETAPGSVEIKVELARVYLVKGKFDDALATVQSIPSAKLPAAAIPIEVAGLIGTGKKAEAAKFAGRVGNSVPLALNLAEVYLRGGLSGEALQTLKSIASAKGLPAHYHYLRGQALLDQRDGVGAEAAFRVALQRDPKSVETLVALAEISSMKQQHGESLKFLTQAHELAPDNLAVLRHMVTEGETSGQRSAAVTAARELVAKSSDQIDDLLLASAAFIQGGDTMDALTPLRTYTSQRADDPRGWLALGMTCLLQKKYDESRSALERAARLAPNNPETEYQLGLLDIEESKREEGIRHLERVLQLQPKHAAALAKLGAVYLQSGDLEKAQQVLSQALAVDPNNPDTEYKLAMVLSKMGKTAESREHMLLFQKLKQTQRAEVKGEGQQ